MTDRPSAADRPDSAPMPRWVKVQGVFLILFVLVVVGMFSGVVNPRLLGLEGGGHAPPAGVH